MIKLRLKQLVGVAIVAAVCLVAPLAATASAPEAVTFQIGGVLTGPTTFAGPWEATGAIDDGGTYVGSARFAGNTVHVVNVFTGAHGTIIVEAEAAVVATSETTLAFKAGSWRVVSGTGAYGSLKGGGTPAADPGTLDLVTGALDVTRHGLVQLD